MDIIQNIALLEKIDSVANMDPNSIKKVFQLNQMLEFATLKSQNPRMKQADLCKQMGTSKSVLQRTRKDLGMSSLYRHDVPLKTKKPVELTTDEILTLKESDDLTPEQEERLDKYLAYHTQREKATQSKEGKRKPTLRDLKSKANEILSSTVVDELKTKGGNGVAKLKNKDKNKNKNKNKNKDDQR
jgi:hypothetical protein